ncbi:MAG TPA: iron-containing alcohol dehydrogenase [Firmicutes bacterium]|jgi:alcohol dehydrogenase|nr:iron-containing alcohol dehydrogenase [Bacillota bacterium]
MIVSFNRSVPALFGAGASLRTGMKVKELGMKKVFCVHDKGIKDAGIADKIIKNLQAAGLEVVVFDGVIADPPDFMINEAGKIANEQKVDGIVGIGGGSTMDTAKAVNVLLTNPPPISQYYVGLGAEMKPGKPLVLLPTTAGTGSEMTAISVVSNTASNTKNGVIGPAATATLAIVDPELTLGLPPHITASTGMDAFSHAAEALTSEGMNPMSDVLAEKAISLITNNLKKAMKNGSDLTARINMSFAALLAGIAFNDALTHWGHAIAHTIGTHYHIPHGVGCALALPGVIEYVADAVPNKVEQIARAMGLSLSKDLSPEELGREVADAIRGLNREVGIPSLKDFNIEKSSLEQIVGNVLADDCAMFGPKRASANQVLSLLNKAYAY